MGVPQLRKAFAGGDIDVAFGLLGDNERAWADAEAELTGFGAPSRLQRGGCKARRSLGRTIPQWQPTARTPLTAF